MWENKQRDVFYEQLCEQNITSIYKYCTRLTKGHSQLTDIVEECAQKTFLEAGKQLIKLQSHPNVKGWLYVTAKNLVLNSYRRMYLKRKYEIVFDEKLKLISDNDELATCLEEVYDIKELSQQVLSTLNMKEYALYHDYFRNCLSIAELSEKYCISNSAVTTRIYRIKSKLKEKIKECFEVI
ncbi:RNA polymerase sigma factor [Paenibacillus sp. FSL H3-0333]|uniref:RNA polymerase sigma factor n=1 Tax=Paenibacillus sp. FSL H3-0333 TaxID=2921373 RepID=UPI0030F9E37B